MLGESLQQVDKQIMYITHLNLVYSGEAASSPLVYLLQCVPTESCPILEDVIQRVQGTQLPPLLLMIDGHRCQRRTRRSWGCEGGRGGRKILLLLSVPGILAPPLLCSHHHLPSSTFLLADLPGHAAQLLEAASAFPLPLTRWIRSASHPWTFAAVTASSNSATTSTATTFGMLHWHHDNLCHGNLSATWKRGACVWLCTV